MNQATFTMTLRRRHVGTRQCLSSVFCDAHGRQTELQFGDQMLKYAIIFAVISLIAAAFGFGGVAVGAASIAKILFGLFLILAVIFVVLAALGVGAIKSSSDR
jgi:uncharacterized membrane protein YtjA (UPF0391 family)